MEDLRQPIREAAQKLGFVRTGFAKTALLPRERFFSSWVDQGMAAEMNYLIRSAGVRNRPQHLLPSAKTAISVAATYASTSDDDTPPPGYALVARYARGLDYHVVLRQRLELLAETVQEMAARKVEHRIAVDTSPLLERELAMVAGVGFIGKNSMLITPGVGSYTVLGTLLVDLELPLDEPARPRCGRCDLCIKACPTGALVEPFLLDARRCISYLTIEHRGPIPRELGQKMSPWIFGCDACQQVCPYNVRAGRRGWIDPQLAPEEPRDHIALVELLRLRSGDYRRLVRDRALARVSRITLMRNAALVAGSTARPGDAELHQALMEVAQHENPLVREAARWALESVTSS